MTERILTTLFSKFLKDHPLDYSATFEIKMCKGSRFDLSQVKEHQIKGLQDSLSGLGHKISDSPIYKGSHNRFTFKKPFDYIYVKAKRAYVVPIFYKPRCYKKVYLIPVSVFSTFEGKSIKMSKLDEYNFESFYL